MKAELCPTSLNSATRWSFRCLIATRDVSAGEVLYAEEALAIGPSADSANVCIVCNKAVVWLDLIAYWYDHLVTNAFRCAQAARSVRFHCALTRARASRRISNSTSVAFCKTFPRKVRN